MLSSYVDMLKSGLVLARQADQQITKRGRYDRARQNAKAYRRGIIGVGEGQRAHKQAHGKADTAKGAQRVNLVPVGVVGYGAQSAFDGAENRKENAHLFSDDKPQHDAKRQRFEQAGKRYSC